MTSQSKTTLGAIALLFVAALLVTFATNKYIGSDPKASLLVSESILTHQTIKLDHYGEDKLREYGYAIKNRGGHFYYYFPLGTPVVSLPFVAIAKVFGLDVSSSRYLMQTGITVVTSVLTLVFLMKLARLFLSPVNALLISAVFWFGTSLVSTSGTALWSHNFATLFALIAIYCAIKATRSNQAANWPVIAIALFLAYFCRPSMAILAPFLLLYLFSYSRAAAIYAGILLAVLLGFLVAFSLHEFGSFLPDYYLPKRLAGGRFQQALLGNLFSPARGLFVYSPFILVAWLCYPFAQKKWDLKKSWLLIGLAWPLCHLVMISRFPDWWAGVSFGSRFMTGVIPGLFLLTLYTWPTRIESATSKIAAGCLILSCVAAIYMNSVQALFNPYAAQWGLQPNINDYPEYLFDWEYPQFLADKDGHEVRMVRHANKYFVPVKAGEKISDFSGRVAFIDWYDPAHSSKWSAGASSKMLFITDREPEKFVGELLLKMRVDALGAQRAAIDFNGTRIFSGELGALNGTQVIRFQPALIRTGANFLAFYFPDAYQPETAAAQLLSLALVEMQLN